MYKDRKCSVSEDVLKETVSLAAAYMANPNNQKKFRKLYDFLDDRSYDELQDLITIMYMGRDQDATMTLPSDKRLVDYWQDLNALHNAPRDAFVHQMISKRPLADYLRRGWDILHYPAQAA